MEKACSGLTRGWFLSSLRSVSTLAGGQGREIGEGALADLGAFALAFAQEDGRGRAAVGDDFHIHGNIIASETDYRK